jgi:hypothetical protein
VRFGASIGVE